IARKAFCSSPDQVAMIFTVWPERPPPPPLAPGDWLLLHAANSSANAAGRTSALCLKLMRSMFLLRFDPDGDRLRFAFESSVSRVRPSVQRPVEEPTARAVTGGGAADARTTSSVGSSVRAATGRPPTRSRSA